MSESNNHMKITMINTSLKTSDISITRVNVYNTPNAVTHSIPIKFAAKLHVFPSFAQKLVHPAHKNCTVLAQFTQQWPYFITDIILNSDSGLSPSFLFPSHSPSLPTLLILPAGRTTRGVLKYFNLMVLNGDGTSESTDD